MYVDCDTRGWDEMTDDEKAEILASQESTNDNDDCSSDDGGVK